MASVHVPTTNNLISLSPTLSFVRRDRRQHHRFPIIAQAEYTFPGHRAQATTLDIGRGGVLLRTDTILRVGQQIEVLIDWPVLLDARCRLRFVVFGKVLRSDWAGTAVGITRYEFRVRGQNRMPLLA
jgi:PilZ domain-containing protein